MKLIHIFLCVYFMSIPSLIILYSMIHTNTPPVDVSHGEVLLDSLLDVDVKSRKRQNEKQDVTRFTVKQQNILSPDVRKSVVKKPVMINEHHELLQERGKTDSKNKQLAKTDSKLSNVSMIGVHKPGSHDNKHYYDLKSKADKNGSNVKNGTETMVLFLANQRTGSSYLGDVLFNDNNDVFYLYEPLDQLYSSMYGTRPAWTVPGDITINRNGAYRSMPGDEFQAVTDYLHQLYTCDVTKHKTQFYAHPFWKLFSGHMREMSSFSECSRHKLYPVNQLDPCVGYTDVCEKAFDGESAAQAMCKRSLWFGEDVSDAEMQEALMTYKHCRSDQMRAVKPCVHILHTSCTRQAIRAIKTVRVTMLEAEDLMQRLPQLKVVHLLRDPRAVVASRRISRWSRSHYERAAPDVSHIAHVFCRTALEDYRVSKQIQKRYPGRLMTLWYEEYAKHPINTLNDIYDFLNITLTEVMQVKIKSPFEKNRLIETLYKWQYYINSTEEAAIIEMCRDLEKETHHHWFTTSRRNN